MDPGDMCPFPLRFALLPPIQVCHVGPRGHVPLPPPPPQM